MSRTIPQRLDIATAKLKAALKRMKKQTCCPPILIVGEPIAVYSDQEDYQESSPESKPPELEFSRDANEEVHDEEHFSDEPPNLYLTANEQEMESLEMPELEGVQSVSVSKGDQVLKDIPSQKRKSGDKNKNSLTYSHSLVVETVSISESSDDENMASPPKLDKIAEERNDGPKLTHSETNSSENRKDMQDSPSDSFVKSTESLPFSGIISYNSSLMEVSFDVR